MSFLASDDTGHARFLDPHTVSVGTETLTGERLFINVGGRPFVPSMPGVDQVPYLTNESLIATRRMRLRALAFEDLFLAQRVQSLGNRLQPLPRDRFATSVRETVRPFLDFL